MNSANWKNAAFIPLMLAILPLAHASAKGTESSVQIAGQWQFDQANDLNYDRWPDGWRRRQGRKYPSYLQIGIVPKDRQLMEAAIRADHEVQPLRRMARRFGVSDWLFSENLVDQYLQIKLNGGAAVLQSPPVPVTELFSYRVSGSVFTSGLKKHAAWFEYLFLDAEGMPIASKDSPKFSGNTTWTHVALKPVGPPAAATSMVLRLHLEPQDGGDIYGEAGFDNLRIDSLPQLKVVTDKRDGLYLPNDRPVATCQVSGLASPVTGLRFRLRDAHENVLEELSTNLDQQQTSQVKKSWELPSLSAGFYRVTADLYDGDAKTHSTVASFAVLGDLPVGSGPFGWTLSTGHDPIARRNLPDWLERCRIGCVKYPCWLDPKDQQGADDLGWLLENLQDRGIRSVGMLDQPAERLRDHVQPSQEPMAPVLRDIESWRPKLEALMTRLSMRTTWWQLGREGDFSFFGQANLAETLDNIRKELQGFGQPIQVAIPWPWVEPVPRAPHGGWKGVSLFEPEPYTADELDAFLENHTGEAMATWITLDPLDANRYSLEDRIHDLVARMIVVRRHSVANAFVSNPFDPRLEILNRDATPGEMFLPWRTTAALIGGLRFQGSLKLPEGSNNVVLASQDRAVIVAWSPIPKKEKIYLGKNPKQVDVWGNITEIPTGPDGRQEVTVDSLPKFLIDVEPSIARFRVAAHLDKTRLESLPGRRQILNMSLENTFGSTLSGSYTMNAPLTWDTDRQARSITFEQSGKTEIPVEISLRSNAAIGQERVRFDFTFDLSQRTTFSVWRDIDVGPEDIEIDPTIRLDENGNLVVRVNMLNLSDVQQRFNLYMLAQSRRHQRIQVSVGPRQQIAKDFIWANGKELAGQTLTLRAEDRNSARLLIYPIPIEL